MAALKTLLAGAGSKQVGAHCNVPPLEANGLLFFPGSLEGCPVVLTASGIGPERAEKATRKLLELFSIKTILSLGYAGALRPGAKTGELVIVRNVLLGIREKTANPPVSPFIKGGPKGDYYPCHHLLVGFAQKVAEEEAKNFKMHLGDLLTVEEPINRPEDKHQAGLLTGTLAVDMESAGVAVAAREAHIPFMALKVILDEVDEELKGTELVDGEGRVRLLKTLVYLLCHPWDIIRFIRLNSQAERAARELTRFLLILVKKLNEVQIIPLNPPLLKGE